MKKIVCSKVPINYFGLFLLFLLLIGVSSILCISIIVFFEAILAEFYVNLNFFLFLFWIFFLVYADLYAIDHILWNITGYEEIKMDEEKLLISKRGRLFKNNIHIKTLEIKSIEEQEYFHETFFSSLFQGYKKFSHAIGETGGRMLIKYGRNGKLEIDFGLGISKKDAKIYVEQMNEILNERRPLFGVV